MGPGLRGSLHQPDSDRQDQREERSRTGMEDPVRGYQLIIFNGLSGKGPGTGRSLFPRISLMQNRKYPLLPESMRFRGQGFRIWTTDKEEQL